MFFPAVNKGGDNLINKKFKHINPKNIEKITNIILQAGFMLRV